MNWQIVTWWLLCCEKCYVFLRSWLWDQAVHRGTGTDFFGSKTTNAASPIDTSYLDLKKAFETLDRSQTIKILQGYGVGENTLRLIQRIWDMDIVLYFYRQWGRQ
jgi:hypothetical protein